MIFSKFAERNVTTVHSSTEEGVLFRVSLYVEQEGTVNAFLIESCLVEEDELNYIRGVAKANRLKRDAHKDRYGDVIIGTLLFIGMVGLLFCI